MITGGSSDIALAIAKHRFEQGDTITVTASSETSLASTLDVYDHHRISVKGIVFSFENPGSICQQVDKPIDALILNAFGQQMQLTPFHEYPLNEILSFAQTNINGNISLLHQALPQMLEQMFGRIVFISSASVAIGTKNYAPYCLAKSALEGLMTQLSVEYARQNVLFNTVRLGLMKTSRTKAFWQQKAYQALVSRLIPQGRMGNPSQVPETIDPLLSKSCYMTGTTLNVTGGLPLMNVGG